MKRVLFLFFTVCLFLLFVVAMWQDSNREWNHYQRLFLGRLRKEERRGLTGGIKQTIIPSLQRVDRCTTCHMAIDKPQLALGAEPFTAHPGKYLSWHPVEKFGCTVCHGGQGLATESAAAHGEVSNWEDPLLRGPLVQASCRQCHGDLKAIEPYVPQLIKGRQLFKAKGCYGCHAVKEFGQTVSQDLTEVGSKSYPLIEADFEMIPLPAARPRGPIRRFATDAGPSVQAAGSGMMAAPHDRIHWLMTKLKHPRVLNPGVRPEQLPPGEEEVFPSAMPNFGLTEDEIQALTVYLTSLTASNLPASYVTPAAPEPAATYATPVERGRAVFEKYGCAACHGIGGAGGRNNWNSGLAGEVPPLFYVKAYYGNDVDSLKTLIRNGRQPAPRADTTRPRPALYMPAWKDRISEEDLDALIAYLFSLSEHLPAHAASSAAGGPAAAASPAPQQATQPSN